MFLPSTSYASSCPIAAATEFVADIFAEYRIDTTLSDS
jgi:hypothetical protein